MILNCIEYMIFKVNKYAPNDLIYLIKLYKNINPQIKRNFRKV